MRRSILVVDDDEDIREALSELLCEEGFSVATAKNGRDAVEWLHGHPAISYVVLLDLMMPIMDGRAFLHARQADPVLSSTPVVVISASGECSEMNRDYEVVDCIQKPIEMPRLLAAIHGCA